MTEMEKSKQEWSGETGLLSVEMLKKYLSDLNLPIYYMVGPPQFVEAMRNMLRAAKIDEEKIRWENFTGY